MIELLPGTTRRYAIALCCRRMSFRPSLRPSVPSQPVGLALDLEDCHPLVLLHCWLGHLTCKIVFEMTYNVSSGTLNPTITYNTILSRQKPALHQNG